MNKYIMADCIKGLKECRDQIEQSKATITELQSKLWNETLELSGTQGILDFYLGMLEREAPEESK